MFNELIQLATLALSSFVVFDIIRNRWKEKSLNKAPLYVFENSIEFIDGMCILTFSIINRSHEVYACDRIEFIGVKTGKLYKPFNFDAFSHIQRKYPQKCSDPINGLAWAMAKSDEYPARTEKLSFVLAPNQQKDFVYYFNHTREELIDIRAPRSSSI